MKPQSSGILAQVFKDLPIASHGNNKRPELDPNDWYKMK